MKKLCITGGLGLAVCLAAILGLAVNTNKNAQAAGVAGDMSALSESGVSAGDVSLMETSVSAGESVMLKKSISEGDVDFREDSISSGNASEVSAPEQEEESEYADLAIADVDHYVNVRSTPDTEGEILGKIYDGAVAHILETAGENGDWFKVTSGSVEGYIKAEFFLYGDAAAAVIDEYVTRYATVTADRLNVRKDPDLSAKRIGYIDNGEQVKVLENLGEWLKVEYVDGEEGYVASEYVTLSEAFTYAKSIAEDQEELKRQRELEEREKASETEKAENTQQETGEEALGTTPDSAAVVQNTSSSETRTAIVEYAMQYLGNAYVHGGSSLAGGTDCSGFTCFIYADFGYSISRTPSGQLSGAGRSIDYSQIQPGDIICYTSNGKSCTHVGLYIGDGQIIHAANARKGVVISDADYSTILGVKNVID